MSEVARIFEFPEFGGGDPPTDTQLVCPSCEHGEFTVWEPLIVVCTNCGMECDPTAQDDG